MRFFGTAIVVLILILVAGAVFVGSGIYNVAADAPHWTVTKEILEIARERSVEHHSGGVNPPSLEDPNLLETGFHHFHATCRLCHEAPGYERFEFAQGMYPSPPDLTEDHVRGELTDAELFWIVRNGLKMTGMPAFGQTHSDEELWGIVAVVKKLPDMTPEEYRAKVEAQGKGEAVGEHHHGEADEPMGEHPHGDEGESPETGHSHEAGQTQ